MGIHLRPVVARRAVAALGAVVAIGAGLAILVPDGVASASSTGTELTVTNGPFGKMVVVGSGTYAGYSLYAITSDVPPKYGCTTTPQTVFGHSIVCTGPSNDKSAEWPALTTTGKPVAGPGVNPKLLGTVNRAKVGDQVTYGGHPLYLFDSMAGALTGEDWFEPYFPPWHGVWYVLNPAGKSEPPPGMLTELPIKGKHVLASVISTFFGYKAAPVYSFSKDSSTKSTCTGQCAIAWPPVITNGSAGVTRPLSAHKVGTIKRADGTTQVTYDGKPLYYFGDETPAESRANDGIAFIKGNGNGIKVNGGTFHLITP